MQSQVIPQLINLAQSSTMSSKHAAAITCGKRLLAIDTNYSLPAGELVNTTSTITATVSATQRKSQRDSYSESRQSLFDQFFERYPSYQLERYQSYQWVEEQIN